MEGATRGKRGQEEGAQEFSPDGASLLRPDCAPALAPLPDVLMVLMTDVLVFLQEKDQKYIFPTLVRPSTFFLKCFRPFCFPTCIRKNLKWPWL